MDLLRVLSCLLLVLLAPVAMSAMDSVRVFNVTDYGAFGDGKTDSTAAFQKAWNDACTSISEGTELLVPAEGTFLVGPLKFKGPCKSPMLTFLLKGTMLGSPDLSLYNTTEWIDFRHIDGLLITGGGRFDGQGALAWPRNDCRINPHCKPLPTSIDFSSVTNATVQHVSSVDSKNFHMKVYACNNMKLRSLNISAPRDSPNTDGIHVSLSSNIEISSSVIGTGDDCVSIGPGNTNVSVSNVFCGPGHGISVGSLGRSSKKEGDVVGISVTNCTLTDTQNGVRIKTWQNSSMESVASNFTFDDIVMKNVENPIVIDQKYCPGKQCGSQEPPSKVKISNIKFEHIRGDTKTQVAINLICSDAFPCEDIELQDIDLKYNGNGNGNGGDNATSYCENVHGKSMGTVIPPSCI